MGTASFSVSKYGTNRGSAAGTAIASTVFASGAHTTSTSATNLADAGGAITVSIGQVLRIHADEAMRIRFGGVAATASTGHYISATEMTVIECAEPGTVSIIDVA